MDDRGRLAQSVTRQAPRRRPAAASRGLLSRSWRRFALPLSRTRMPRYAGAIACLTFLSAAALYGMVRGEHIAAFVLPPVLAQSVGLAGRGNELPYA